MSTVRPVYGNESTELCLLTLKHVESDQTKRMNTTKVIATLSDCPRIGKCRVVWGLRNKNKNKFPPSSLWESWNCVLHMRTVLDSQRIEKENSINYRLDALSIPHYVIKTRRCQGPRHGKTEEHKGYHQVLNASKRCQHSTGIHDRFLRYPVYRESRFAIRSSKKSVKSGMNLRKKIIHVNFYCRGKEKTRKTIASYSEQNKQKWAYEASIWLQSRCHDKKSFTHECEEPIEKSPPSKSTKTNTTRTRTILQRLLLHRSSWSTYWMTTLAFISRFLVEVRIRIELEVRTQFFFWTNSLFWLRLQLIAIHFNRPCVWTEHPHSA